MEPSPPARASATAPASVEERIAVALTRDSEGLSPRERWAEVLVGGSFAIVATLIAVLLPWDGFDPIQVALVLVAFAAANRVRFPVPDGYTSPVVLVTVPALFTIPLPAIPLLFAGGFALSALPDVLRRRASPSRVVFALANAWFVVGPVVVLALWGAENPLDVAPWVLLAAFAAQVACDVAASWSRERVLGGPPLRELLRQDHWLYLVDLGFAPVGFLVAVACTADPLALALVLPLLALLQVFAAERRNRMEQLVELSNAYRGTAMVLGDVVESDDAYTGEHTRGVVELALTVGQELGLSARVLQRLEFGALLHDVGKVAVPKEIINKPGPLDPHEWDIIKTHTVEGQRMLDTVGGLMKEIGTIVRAHHERWDGSGYPDGLVGEQIPIESRIVSACDTWNAMTTTRSYRAALSFEVAMEELVSVAGTQLDPAVVEALVRVLQSTEATRPPAEAPAAVAAVEVVDAEIVSPAAVARTAGDGGQVAPNPAPAVAAAGGMRRVALGEPVRNPVVAPAVEAPAPVADPARPAA